MGLFDGKNSKAKAGDLLSRMGQGAAPSPGASKKADKAAEALAKMAPKVQPAPYTGPPGSKPAPKPAAKPVPSKPQQPAQAPRAPAQRPSTVSGNKLVEGRQREIPLDAGIEDVLGKHTGRTPDQVIDEPPADMARPVKVIKKAAPRGPDPETQKRLEELEKRLAGLKDVNDLSEILSVKYNPFLDEDEASVFEGRYSAGDLVQAQKRGPKRKPLWAQSGYVESWNDELPPPIGAAAQAPTQQAAPAHAPQAPPQAAPVQPSAPTMQYPSVQIFNGPNPDQKQAEPEKAPSKPGPAFEEKDTVSPDEAANRRKAAMESEPVIYKQKKASNPRESFLAMHWFTYLSDGTSPSIIFLYLDYYKYVGWIDDETHDWLTKLAEGVASRKSGAAWEDFGLDVNKLAGNHMRNLRFIDKLLGTTLQHGEADYLRQTVDMLLMGDD